MKKWMMFISLLLILLPLTFASTTIDSEMQKITHYAEEYETGNINYAQLLVYLSSARQNFNELLEATDKEYGGILKQEQIENVLGRPQHETKWVWVQDEEKEKKLDSPLPTWEKIIFDGKKISIKLHANPFLFKKISNELRERIWDLEEQGKFEEANELRKTGEENLGYNLNFEVDFKKPKDVLNIETRIKEIQGLAETFNKEPSKTNAENLAEESVNTERSFEVYSRQNPENCEDFMRSLFGPEYLRETAGILSYQINFYEGENFEAIIKLEMCEECQWNWINLNMWYESRGKFKNPEIKSEEENLKKDFENKNIEEFKTETVKLIESMKTSLQQEDFSSAIKNSHKLNALTNAWNEKSNNVWKEAEELIKIDENSMTDKEREEFNKNYGWLKLEQQKREKVKELQKKNFEERKMFYLSLFADYEYTESYAKQTEYEKRLIQEFRIFEQEKCDNNQDDNQNGEIDCADSECSGKFCGTLVETNIAEGNSTETKKNLYCIAKICQQKEELIVKENFSVCGNNICEYGEELNCSEDCASCPVYPAIECSDGKVIFKGKDERGCMLEPICLKEKTTCKTKEDCSNPLCGNSDCIEGTCQIINLEECREAECEEGQEKMKKCGNQELIIEICKEGLWIKTEIECTEETSSEEEIIEKEIIGQECQIKDDCGGKNDVCSNGKCVTLPSIIEKETYEIGEQTQKPGENQGESEQVKEEQTTGDEKPKQEEQIESELVAITGQAILGSIKTILTGWDVEGGNPEPEATSNPEPENTLQTGSNPKSTQNPEPETNQNPENNVIQNEGNYEQEDKNKKDNEERRWKEEEKERRKEECKDRCSRECNERLIKPCVENCVWEKCGNDLECNIDEMTKGCEETCKSEKNTEECENECYEKCVKGEETWIEPERKEQKQEKGVFNVGGGCRNENTKTNAFLWFNGWGDPFEQIQPLKEKYYSGGQADWCKWELEDLQKQRKEFEKSFNYDFVVWFFEKYLTNSAEDWEQSQSGIYEIYWQGGVDISRQIAERMNCLGIKEIPFDYKLINFTYETEYGRVEYWEEIKTINLEENNKEKNNELSSSGETEIISPYMKVWIFPPKEFIISQTKKAMKEGKFPGPENNKEETGPTEQEKEQIKQDDKFMEKIRELSNKYGGSFDVAVQLKNYETDEIVFNLYAKISEQEIIEIKPMLLEEIPEQDAKIIIDFDKVYNLIYLQEKEMRGSELESPPWDKKPRQKSIKQITNNVKKGLQIAGILNSAEITPEDAKKDFNKMFRSIFKMMINSEDKGNYEEETEDGEEKLIESLSGEIIKKF